MFILHVEWCMGGIKTYTKTSPKSSGHCWRFESEIKLPRAWKMPESFKFEALLLFSRNFIATTVPAIKYSNDTTLLEIH